MATQDALKHPSLPFKVPPETASLLARAPSVTVPASLKNLYDLAIRDHARQLNMSSSICLAFGLFLFS